MPSAPSPTVPRRRAVPTKIVRGWTNGGGPVGLLANFHRGALPRWVSHAYRYRLNDGRTAYVAEPYHLDAQAFEDLLWLTREGFTVDVSGAGNRHDPGTVVITITKRLAYDDR